MPDRADPKRSASALARNESPASRLRPGFAGDVAARRASGTIDDEGEDLDDAYVAIDQYLTQMVRPNSYIVLEREAVIAFSFVSVVNELHYIDPVVVAPPRNCQGLGRATVGLCLGSLARAGVLEVSATITDGNLASERLFLGLGFSRYGAWA